jgi:hypothetical protein
MRVSDCDEKKQQHVIQMFSRLSWEPKSSHTTAREPRDWRVRAGWRAAMAEPFEFPEFFDYPPYFTCVPRRCRPSALGPSDFV